MGQLKDLAFWDEQYVRELPIGEFEWLDFKASSYFAVDAGFLDRVSPYLSAFANYEGGYLVFGVENPTPGNPLKFDRGVDLNIKANLTEWLESKLPNLVDPPLARIQAVAVPRQGESSDAAPGHAILVIYVPPSEQAPHQARDRKYYNRLGNKLHPMNHRTLMDIIGRKRYPCVNPSIVVAIYSQSDQYHLICRLENSSAIMARSIYCEIDVPVVIASRVVHFPQATMHAEDDRTAYWKLLVSNDGYRPLFPKGEYEQVFNFHEIPGPLMTAHGKQIVKSLPLIRVKVFADEMPFVEREFDLESVIKRI